MQAILDALTPARTALLIALAAAATLAGAWVYQWLGYLPCELCYYQRWAYYAALPLGLATAVAPPRARKAGLVLLGLLFVGSAIFGLYHSGVEWKLWEGPSACTGQAVLPRSPADLLGAIETTRVVRCDVPALYVFGLTLASWNAIISSGLAALGFAAARRAA